MTGEAERGCDSSSVRESREPGVSTFHLVCGPQVRETCDLHVRRWARDRALSTKATNRLRVVTSASLGHGLRYGPRGVSVILRWADPDSVRVDIRWHGCATVARGALGSQELESTAALLDAVTHGWGFAPGAPGAQWLVVDARS
jgi:hypothetical protein